MSDIYEFLAFVFALGMSIAIILGHSDVAKFFFAGFVVSGLLDTVGRMVFIFFGGTRS